MRPIVLVVIAVASVFFRSSHPVWGQEVPYTLEDRDRLIRVETTLKEFKESVDKRIESVDKRIERLETVMMGGFGLLFTSMIGLNQTTRDWHTRIVTLSEVKGLAVRFFAALRMTRLSGRVVKCTNVMCFDLVGFVLWDRRTALAPAIRASREVAEREDRIERALQELAQTDPRVAEALKHVGLL